MVMVMQRTNASSGSNVENSVEVFFHERRKIQTITDYFCHQSVVQVESVHFRLFRGASAEVQKPNSATYLVIW